MELQPTNKHHQTLSETFGDNTKILEENLKKTDWQFFARFYFYLLGLILVTIFGIVVVFKLAVALGNAF